MKKDRQELEITLYKAIKESKENKWKNREYILDSLKKHNINLGTITGMYGVDKVLISSVSDEVLYLFVKALYETTTYERINPNDWFNPLEITAYNEYKKEEDEHYKNDVVIFYDVSKTSDFEYLCPRFAYPEMKALRGQGLLYYNERTQREPTLVSFGGEYQKMPTINQNKIIDIAEMMETNFEANMLSLNIRKLNREQKFEYNEKNRTLTIWIDNENTYLDIIDGMHRWLAAERCISENPSNPGYFHIKIFNFSELRAQSYLNREEKATPMQKSHREGYDNRDENVLMIKEINEYGNSTKNEMYYKIAEDDSDLKVQGKFTTIETLKKAIRYNFGKFENAEEIEEAQDFLIRCFNKILITLKKKYTKENSVIFENNIFIGYVALVSILIKEENWKELLENILNSIDFSNDYDWKSVGISSDKINNSLIKKISEHFKKVGVINV